MFIHREERKNGDDMEYSKGNSNRQLIIAKHSNGPTGKIEYEMDLNSLRFKELDRIHGDLAIEEEVDVDPGIFS